MARKQPRRFGSYAAMEAGNVVLVPGFVLWLAEPETRTEYALLVAPVLAVVGFLIVGTLFWRGLHKRLQGSRKESRQALRFADWAEKPLLAVLLVAALATLLLFWLYGLDGSTIAGGVLTLLAGLEYVNYYHRQLQHFDNAADLKRLLSGGGFRRAHMARELAEFRGR